MSLPISSKIKRRRHKKDPVVTKAKLPTQATSKNQRKCPICGSPYVNVCLNCDFKNDTGIFWGDELFKKANESYDREKKMEL